MRVSRITALVIYLAINSLATVASNAESDLAVEKSVDNPNLLPDNPAEFTITVVNNGPDAADNIEVTDRLPDGLEIPAGLAAFTSQGTYEESTGLWQVGSLAESQAAEMSVPAIPTNSGQPMCYENVAEITGTSSVDPFNLDNTARVTILSGGATSCAELILAVSPDVVPGECFGRGIFFYFDVTNRGPWLISEVTVTLTANFGSALAAEDNPIRIDSLGPGETIRRQLLWNMGCPEPSRTVKWTAELAVDTYLSEDSITLVSGRSQVPGSSSCDCIIDYGEGEGCFIATAVYGSHLDSHVIALRMFRDEFLLTNAVGRKLVDLYYQYSPPIAAVISEHEPLRFVVQLVLTPIVYAVSFPLVPLAMLSALTLAALKSSKPNRRVRKTRIPSN